MMSLTRSSGKRCSESTHHLQLADESVAGYSIAGLASAAVQ